MISIQGKFSTKNRKKIPYFITIFIKYDDFWDVLTKLVLSEFTETLDFQG